MRKSSQTGKSGLSSAPARCAAPSGEPFNRRRRAQSLTLSSLGGSESLCDITFWYSASASTSRGEQRNAQCFRGMPKRRRTSLPETIAHAVGRKVALCVTIVAERRVRPANLPYPKHDIRGDRPRNKAILPSFKKKQIVDDSLIAATGCIG